ncbi:hypothetical protein OIU79_023752 [Salix purpurea]|uniref:C2 domain-containing protein n=1 Tax=Salix purpurea TaxID=77065 RepID=A0A9Q0W9H3_SALPP|nr:hypothetical protein OIU79_023752 [Salix purpurea]
MATKQKLIVEVVDARNLLPKDGHGSSTWNETLEFNVGKPSNVFGDMLELEVFHDKNHGPTRRINHLGRLKLSSSQFVRRGEEALIYYPLEKKYMLSFIQGEIGLKIYYQDEVIPPPPLPQPAAAQEEEAKADTRQESPPPQPAEEAAVTAEAQKSDAEAGATTEPNKEQPAEEAKSNEEPPAQAEAEAPAAPTPPPDNAPAPPPQGPSGQNKEDPVTYLNSSKRACSRRR